MCRQCGRRALSELIESFVSVDFPKGCIPYGEPEAADAKHERAPRPHLI